MTVLISPRTFPAYPVPTTGLVVYASPTSTNTTGTGTSAQPVTFTRAKDIINASTSGGTIVLQGGRYMRPSGQFSKPVTLQPAANETVILDGTQVVTGFSTTANADGLYTKTGYTTAFAKFTYGVTAAHPESGGKQALFINGIRYYSEGSIAALKAGTSTNRYYIDEAADTIYLRENPSGKTVETIASSKPLQFLFQATGSKLLGLCIVGFADTAVMIQCPNALVENCVMEHAGYLAVDVYSTNVVVRNNNIRYSGTNAISFHTGANGLQALGNELAYTNRYSPTDPASSAAAMKGIKASGIRAKENNVHDNNCTGIWYDESVVDSFITKNILNTNNGLNIEVEISQRVLVVGNLSINSQAGVFVSGAQDVKVYNNTLVNNSTAIVVKDSGRRTDANNPDAAVHFQKNCRIKNNICSTARFSGNNFHVRTETYLNELSSAYISLLDLNVYYRPNVNQPQYHTQWSNASGQDLKYVDMAAFKAQNPFDAFSVFVTNATNTVIGSDYKLLATSPGRTSNGVMTTTTLPADVALELGLPENTPVDVGAYQYVAPTTVDACATRIDDAVEPLNLKVAELTQTLEDEQEKSGSLSTSLVSVRAELLAEQQENAGLIQQVDSLNSEVASLKAQISSSTAIADLKAQMRADLLDYKAKLTPPVFVEIDADLSKYE